MRLIYRTRLFLPWLGLALGLWMVSLPLVAMAVDFKPPRRGAPGRREGGGTRDPLACIQGSTRLTAIMPETNFGLTTVAYPRFFWATPKTRAKAAEFKLVAVDEKTADETMVYQTTFRITGEIGVASLTLPHNATLPPLAVGQDYRWSIAMICDPSNRNRDIKVDGWIQRTAVEPGLTTQLTKANATDRIRLYANNGIWFDTLASLAELRCARPKDAALTASWVELMKSVKLGAIAEQPFVQQCEP